jgi:hypothetical protein
MEETVRSVVSQRLVEEEDAEETVMVSMEVREEELVEVSVDLLLSQLLLVVVLEIKEVTAEEVLQQAQELEVEEVLVLPERTSPGSRGRKVVMEVTVSRSRSVAHLSSMEEAEVVVLLRTMLLWVREAMAEEETEETMPLHQLPALRILEVEEVVETIVAKVHLVDRESLSSDINLALPCLLQVEGFLSKVRLLPPLQYRVLGQLHMISS